MAARHERSVREIYDGAGFGGTLGWGSTPALLVVDLTRGFTDPAFATGADLTEIVGHTAGLIDLAHNCGLPVAYTVLEFSPAEVDSLAWLRKAPGLAILERGSAAAELDPRLPRADSDLVVSKVGASAFHGTHLAGLLTALGADTLIVCGATTSGCVRASVVDAIQCGFMPVVPRQCVGDRAQAPHDAALFDMQEKYADVIDVDAAREYLAAGLARRPARADEAVAGQDRRSGP